MVHKKIALIHTSFVLVDALKHLCTEIMPDVRAFHLVDDSLLAEVIAAGGITPGVTRRLCRLVVSAEEIGVDAILNVCSSVGQCARAAQSVVNVPIVKIDEAMARQAVVMGASIGVVATLKTTLKPTVELVREKAGDISKDVRVSEQLCRGAFEALISGDAGEHDRIVLDGIRRAAEKSDVVVLAQGSMARLAPRVRNVTDKPVLTSPRLGVEDMKAVLDKR